jgi:hypothetical protein
VVGVITVIAIPVALLAAGISIWMIRKRR